MTTNPPNHLSDQQKSCWLEIAQQITRPLSKLQLEHLEGYAIERSRLLDAEAFLREHGATILLRNDKGEVKSIIEAPQLRIAQKSREASLFYLSKLKI